MNARNGLRIAAAVTLIGVAGGVIADAMTPANTAPAPRSCSKPALPSGDAARLDGKTFVCTDGTWVRVTHYGNTATPASAGVSHLASVKLPARGTHILRDVLKVHRVLRVRRVVHVVRRVRHPLRRWWN